MDPFLAKAVGMVVVLGLMTLVWADSLRRQDASLVDRWWGVLFVVLGVFYAGVGTVDNARRPLLAILVTIWGLRLAGFITWRNWGEGEDQRYAAMRRKDPDGFPRRSLFTVFWGQAVLAWFIASPLFYVHFLSGAGDSLNLLDVLGVAIWSVGFLFEAVGDLQLARFLKDPANKGKVMDRGLWRFTRHPNYFGDVTVWVGFYVIALAGGAWWAFYGPVIMTVLIVKVSGVALTDKIMTKGSKRAGYDEYVARTNAFFPWFPKTPEQG